MVRFENKDCLELLRELPDGCIDLMLQDPPYGVTQNEWDKEPFLPLMWAEWERVLKPFGVWVFTATNPFASNLINSRRGLFKHDWVWEKNLGSNFLNTKREPMKQHELVIVFSRGKGTYNPQKINRIDKERVNYGYKDNGKRDNYNDFNDATRFIEDKVYRCPSSVIKFDVERGMHPTQKPVDLMRYLVRTYSNEGDTVFDGYSGSGTTAVACIKEKRKFIGCELNDEYYSIAQRRIKEESSKLVLF